MVLFPVATAKQNQRGTVGAAQSKKARIVEVGSYNDPVILFCASDNLDVGRTYKTKRAGVNGIVPIVRQPLRHGWRQRHIDQELHLACSTVSSSARDAA